MNELPEIKKPVFILGPERSGTTLLYSILSNADEFYWFSRIDSLIPNWPILAEIGRRVISVVDKNPYVARQGKISSIKGINTPTECNVYWRKIFGWGDEQDYLVGDDRFTEDDLTVDQIKFIRKDFKKRLRYSGKKRMLLKQPGFSLKLRFWNEVFPDAKYLICTRNIEDNVCSLVKAKEESDENFWGTKVDEWRDYLISDFRTQALLQLKKIYSCLVEDLKYNGIVEKTMVVSYDQLLFEPQKQMERIIQFCEIGYNEEINLATKGIINQDLPEKFDHDLNLTPIQVCESLKMKAEYLFKNGTHKITPDRI